MHWNLKNQYRLCFVMDSIVPLIFCKLLKYMLIAETLNFICTYFIVGTS